MQETQEMWVLSLGQEDPLEEGMAAESSILAWRVPWTEGPGRLQSIGLQRVRHDWAASLRYADDTTLTAESEEELKSLLMKLKEESEKIGIWSHHFMANWWGKNGNSERLFLGPAKSLQMVIAAMKLKDVYSLEGNLWPTYSAY